VSFNSQVCIIFIYNLLQIFNFDKLVMLRENSKNFTYAFCKSGALHEASKKPVDSPPKSSHFLLYTAATRPKYVLWCKVTHQLQPRS